MITKPYANRARSPDPRQRAGDDAERQMAHYLHRAFQQHPSVFVLHGLRLRDEAQAEQDGSPGVCQIDHLLVHRRGIFIVESKSVRGEVRVRDDGSHGDEWTRVYRGREEGMKSPILQAQRQADFLRAYLGHHDDRLLGRMPVGLRTIERVVAGSSQRGFDVMPIQIMVAISDGGTIRRIGGWKEDTKPFRVVLTKADLIPSKVDEELRRHRKGRNPLALPQGQYGLWDMTEDEASGVADFLAEHHVERPTGSESATPTAPDRQQRSSDSAKARGNGANAALPACRHCSSIDLTANWGKFGYYWRCGACGKNTSMPTVCSSCGANGRRDASPRIRKQGPSYFRDCRGCGTSERIWTQS